jgi:hypothetical protein
MFKEALQTIVEKTDGSLGASAENWCVMPPGWLDSGD